MLEMVRLGKENALLAQRLQEMQDAVQEQYVIEALNCSDWVESPKLLTLQCEPVQIFGLHARQPCQNFAWHRQATPLLSTAQQPRPSIWVTEEAGPAAGADPHRRVGAQQ